VAGLLAPCFAAACCRLEFGHLSMVSRLFIDIRTQA
jgi:hypothetical protein